MLLPVTLLCCFVNVVHLERTEAERSVPDTDHIFDEKYEAAKQTLEKYLANHKEIPGIEADRIRAAFQTKFEDKLRSVTALSRYMTFLSNPPNQPSKPLQPRGGAASRNAHKALSWGELRDGIAAYKTKTGGDFLGLKLSQVNQQEHTPKDNGSLERNIEHMYDQDMFTQMLFFNNNNPDHFAAEKSQFLIRNPRVRTSMNGDPGAEEYVQPTLPKFPWGFGPGGMPQAQDKVIALSDPVQQKITNDWMNSLFPEEQKYNTPPTYLQNYDPHYPPSYYPAAWFSQNHAPKLPDLL